MKRDFSRSRYIIYLLLIIVVTSCSKTEVTDNVVINQAFSLPIGEKELDITQSDWTFATMKPGPYGTFYFNGIPYPINTPLFVKNKAIDFNLDKDSRSSYVTRMDLIIRIENGFPSNAHMQIYLLDDSQQITDSVFLEENQMIPAGEINSLSEVVKAEQKVYEASFEGDRLARLKNTKSFSYRAAIETRSPYQDTLRFSYLSKIKVNMAVRLFVNYNLNET